MESLLRSFLYGLQPRTPKQAADLWLLGVENRSGAVQYAVLGPELQKRTWPHFNELHWVTGQSSPWVDNLRYIGTRRLSDRKVQFTISYTLVTSYGSFGKGTKVVTVERDPAPYSTHWFITRITTSYFPVEAVTPAEEIFKHVGE